MSGPILSEADHARVSDAVAAVESRTAGEVLTVLTKRSDGSTDVALCWSAIATLLALCALVIVPDAALSLYERVSGGWVHDWSARSLFSIAAVVAVLAFGGTMLLQAAPAIRFVLVPGPIKTGRVHDRALQAFRVGAEQRTTGRTGVLIYLSMRERRAEVLADAAIARKVDPQVWAEALGALLTGLRQDDVAGGMCAAVEQVGVVLSEHFPRGGGDFNELPDRLIEV